MQFIIDKEKGTEVIDGGKKEDHHKEFDQAKCRYKDHSEEKKKEK